MTQRRRSLIADPRRDMGMSLRFNTIIGRVAAFLCGYCLVASPLVFAVTVTSVTIPRPEGPRHYLLARPGLAAAEKLPLIILLHGHAGSAAQIFGQEHSAAPFSVWLKIADREGLLAAPDGAKGRDGKPGWNDCRADADNNPETDDVGLVRAIIVKEMAEHRADPARVYVMGMSNGGMMAFRLAAEIGGRLAGFAAVSASMAAQSACPPPGMPVSALIVSGTADPLVPYAGGNVHFISSSSRGGVIGVEQSAWVWRQTDGLPAAPGSVAVLTHLDKKDKTAATRTLWGVDAHGLQVELLRVDGGGHVEPSISQRFRRIYTLIVGPQNGDVEIAEEAWAFFRDKRAGFQPKAGR